MFASRRTMDNRRQPSSNLAFTSVFSAPLQGTNLIGTMNTTHAFNEEFSQIFSTLNERRQGLQSQVNALPVGDHSLRNQGVQLAWRYEKSEITMGGKGSANWTDEELQEILNTRRVRGAEGHHINSVSEHPLDQANPDNIKFVKSRAEHLDEHGGNWQNSTEGDYIDRNVRLEEVNRNRVLKNELTGIGLAAAIGMGVGLTIGVVTTLAKQGVSAQALVQGVEVGMKTGIESSALAVVNHLVVRGIQEVATTALVQSGVEKFGFVLTENLIKVCNMAVIGTVSSIVFSTWVFIKLKWRGERTQKALQQSGKTLGISLGMLFISLISQSIWGGHAGIIVSISVGFAIIIYQFIKMKINVFFQEKLNHYTIHLLKPNPQL